MEKLFKLTHDMIGLSHDRTLYAYDFIWLINDKIEI